MSLRRDVVAVIVGSMLLVPVSGSAAASSPHDHDALGKVDFPVSCSTQAQAGFDRALALLHHMTYPQAHAAFEQVAATDPECAMARWGIAMTLFQPLWPTRPGPEARQAGWAAVQKAKSLHPQADREGLFIAAAEAFFLDPAATDYWVRIRRWEQAQQKAYEALPQDPEAAVFYALAHLATTPSDVVDRSHADRAAAILLKVYESNPDHPGAMHYLVHANDVPGRERELLEITRKYERIAPNNPHALHMPTHIYTRLGDWDRVISGNLRAADAALAHPAGDQGQYVWDEFPHTLEYLVYAYLQKGDDQAAAAQLQRLRATERLEPTFKTAFHLASTQSRYVLERQAWDEAARLVPRQPATLDWDRFAWPEATVQFARGLGAVHIGEAAIARQAVERLQVLESVAAKGGEDLFARSIRILRLELSAWLAWSQDEQEASVTLMRQAVELEQSTPKHSVTPGPTLPAGEQLGDLLQAQKRPAEALAAYQRSLEAYPARFNSLLGAARAAEASGATQLSNDFHGRLLQVAGESTRPVLKQIRDAGHLSRSP
ncbi:hypothetical protein [Povalibacter sp.]|uniref:tetratricopeptide repeat protein n=1 Tax=Povalibacter sp. TaxID=1962978 RepID=UPI002F409E0A